jgi:hypothetical protein
MNSDPLQATIIRWYSGKERICNFVKTIGSEQDQQDLAKEFTIDEKKKIQELIITLI